MKNRYARVRIHAVLVVILSFHGLWAQSSGTGKTPAPAVMPTLPSTWKEQPKAGEWSDLASSKDGVTLAAVFSVLRNTSYVVTSADSGVTWTEHLPLPYNGNGSAQWACMACNEGGSQIIAGQSGGDLYLGKKTGTTGAWTWSVVSSQDPIFGPNSRGSNTKNWSAVASDADGSVLIAASFGVYVSEDSGVKWWQRDLPVGLGGVTPMVACLACSEDGKVIVACPGDADDDVHVSYDTGKTWHYVGLPAIGIEAVRYNCESVTMTADGRQIVVGTRNHGVLLGNRANATDTTWTWSRPIEGGEWSVAGTGDGQKIIAAKKGGKIQVSTDGGKVWGEHETNRWWSCVSVSNAPKGLQLVAGTLYNGERDAKQKEILGKIYIGAMTPSYYWNEFAATFSYVPGGSRGHQNGRGAAAKFYGPEGLTIDADGNLFVCDRMNKVIRKITPTADVTDYVGAGPGSTGNVDGKGTSATFTTPNDLVFDSNGNLFVTDLFGHCVRKVAPDLTVTTIAGKAGVFGSADGTGKAAEFKMPTSIDIDKDGNLYVADSGNKAVRKITPQGVVSTLAGGPTSDKFEAPKGVLVLPDGSLLVSDSMNATIHKVTATGQVSLYAGKAGVHEVVDGPLANARFYGPGEMVRDQEGNVYVAESIHVIAKISVDGMVTTIGGQYNEMASKAGLGTAAKFAQPASLVLDKAGNLFYSESFGNRVSKGTLISP
jgi:sugar lactone lactonase YvrE